MYEVLKIEFNERKRAAEYWLKKYKFYFVVITCKDGSKATGVLKELTPLNYLLISDNDKYWEIDPLNVTNFYGRPDKFAANRGVKNL